MFGKKDLTVIVLDPAIFPFATSLALGGYANKAKTVMPMPNPDWLIMPNEADKRTEQLNELIGKALCGKSDVLCFGWSQGARLNDKWLRDYGPNSDYDPQRLSFLCIGDPENPGGSCAVPNPAPKTFGIIQPKPDFGGCGIPRDTKYNVANGKREFDGWADVSKAQCPSKEALSVPDDAYHMDYGLLSPIRLTNKNLQMWQDGNILHFMWPTKLLKQPPPNLQEIEYGTCDKPGEFWRPYNQCGKLPKEWRCRLKL